jgi:hypothetical protein
MATKRKATRRPIEARVALLPVARAKLTPTEALGWLRDEFRGYLALVEGALELSPDLAAGQLLSDLEEMVSCAAQAALTGAPLKLTRGEGFANAPLRQLAELVTGEEVTDTGYDRRDRAARALGRELVRGIGSAE